MKKIFITGAVIFLATGCSKFLDQVTPGKLPTDEFYKTDADALQATTAVYDMMQAEYTFGFASTLMLKTMPSDESNAGGSTPGDQPGYQTLDKFTYDSENDIVLKVWRTIYYAINRANQVIDHVKPETALTQRLVGEALALRAYNYLDLVSLWGDVPLILTSLDQSEFTTQKRAPKADVYAQIEKDLLAAIPLLPLKSKYEMKDKFRVSKGAAQAILGKAYLYQGLWTKSSEQLQAVINSGEYTLEPNIGKIFAQSSEFGQESLFELSYMDQLGSTGRGRESNMYILLMGLRSTGYTMAPGDSLPSSGYGFNLPTDKIYQAFVSAGDVARKTQTVMSLADLRAKGGNLVEPGKYGFEDVIRRKYANYTTESSNAGGNGLANNYGTNWRLIRYADVLLMAAEAYNKAGNDANARTELNKVRKRAALADVTVGGAPLFQSIVTERELELAFEGSRFIDLVRWGLATQELGSRGFIKGKHELMPIPNNEVRSSGIAQNPGY